MTVCRWSISIYILPTPLNYHNIIQVALPIARLSIALLDELGHHSAQCKLAGCILLASSILSILHFLLTLCKQNASFNNFNRHKPQELESCDADCRITYCHTCYYADEYRPLPNDCDTCSAYPKVFESAYKCFKRWAVCTRRANGGRYPKVF